MKSGEKSVEAPHEKVGTLKRHTFVGGRKRKGRESEAGEGWELLYNSAHVEFRGGLLLLLRTSFVCCCWGSNQRPAHLPAPCHLLCVLPLCRTHSRSFLAPWGRANLPPDWGGSVRAGPYELTFPATVLGRQTHGDFESEESSSSSTLTDAANARFTLCYSGSSLLLDFSHWRTEAGRSNSARFDWNGRCREHVDHGKQQPRTVPARACETGWGPAGQALARHQWTWINLSATSAPRQLPTAPQALAGKVQGAAPRVSQWARYRPVARCSLQWMHRGFCNFSRSASPLLPRCIPHWVL